MWDIQYNINFRGVLNALNKRVQKEEEINHNVWLPESIIVKEGRFSYFDALVATLMIRCYGGIVVLQV